MARVKKPTHKPATRAHEKKMLNYFLRQQLFRKYRFQQQMMRYKLKK